MSWRVFTTLIFDERGLRLLLTTAYYYWWLWLDDDGRIINHHNHEVLENGNCSSKYIHYMNINRATMIAPAKVCESTTHQKYHGIIKMLIIEGKAASWWMILPGANSLPSSPLHYSLDFMSPRWEIWLSKGTSSFNPASSTGREI